MQFLSAFSPLLEEALAQSVDIRFKDVPTRVMRAEHLVAVMLQTGRAKDFARVLQFLEEGAVETSLLTDVLSRHELTSRWEEFKGRSNL